MLENKKSSFLNYKRVLSACLLLSVAIPTTLLFSRVEAKVTLDGDAITKPIHDASNNGFLLASKSSCQAKFTANNTTTENWVDLGEVGGFLSFQNKKKKCLEKGKDYVSQLKFSDFGLTGQQICDNEGKVDVYIDTEVEGKVNSRDGSVKSNLQAKCVCIPKYQP